MRVSLIIPCMKLHMTVWRCLFSLQLSMWPYNVDQNLTLTWPNSCGRMPVFLLLKCTVLFVFLPARSSTYTITGLLVAAGHPIPSAKNAWMNLNLYSVLSYANVQAHPPASVMYFYGRLRHSEVSLPTLFSALHSIYENSNWLAGHYITNIRMQ